MTSSAWTSASYSENLEALIGKYAPRGILVDANLLVLLLGTQFDPDFPGTGRAAAYSVDDVAIVRKVVERFGKIVSTSHVMAETSNFLRQDFKRKKRDSLMRQLHPIFCGDVDGFLEESVDKKQINPYIFVRLGLTDAALAVASGKFPIFTADLDLHIAVGSQGGDSINFWHLKEAMLGW